MKIDVLCWGSSIILAAAIGIWSRVGGYNDAQMVFALVIYSALVYQHGYLLFLKKKRYLAFTFFYGLPWMVSTSFVVSNLSHVGVAI